MLTAERSLSQSPHAPTEQRVALSNDEKWRAVLSRDDRFDGLFVFAVRSTGIYCRPSCSARHPGKDRVVFFSGSTGAEQSGFRPCRRCRPQENASSLKTRLEQVCAYIEANLQRKLTLSILSRQVGLSPYHFQRTFKNALGVSPRQYVEARRLDRMKRFLRRGETVNSSLFNAGFSSRSRVYENIPGAFGINPGEFRRGGEGLQIRYGIVDSPLGRLLVATTERGVCSVCIGDSDAFVEKSLADDYPSATLYRNDQEMKEWTGAFEKYFGREHLALDLPLDVKATAFQSRVWKIIQSIPFGKTTTYSQIAQELGQPEASRAVARACATNPVALVIPCHRVVGKDGKLRGYRWGQERKQALLDLEQSAASSRVKN
jgi:AraC family transcriptional regulator, regulatory protein of adaptative response / methylated-DNA-[protein]-cysteine methyltransferase